MKKTTASMDTKQKNAPDAAVACVGRGVGETSDRSFGSLGDQDAEGHPLANSSLSKFGSREFAVSLRESEILAAYFTRHGSGSEHRQKNALSTFIQNCPKLLRCSFKYKNQLSCSADVKNEASKQAQRNETPIHPSSGRSISRSNETIHQR